MNEKEHQASIRGHKWEHAFHMKFEDIFFPENTPKLYHYTNMEGLYGILNSQSLWASNISFINDSSEYTYALSRFRSVLGAASAQIRSKDLSCFFAEADSLFSRRSQGVYCISFCEKGDLLSQWRGYGGGSVGFAVGFPNKSFHLGIGDENAQILTGPFKVVYQEDIIDSVIRTWFLDVMGLYASEDQETFWNLAKTRQILSPLDLCFPIFKHCSFQEESEWRIVLDEDPNFYSGNIVKFRPRGNLLLPYVPLYALKIATIDNKRSAVRGNLPIDEIVVGPSENQELIIDSIRLYLEKNNMASIAVVPSQIPYRS